MLFEPAVVDVRLGEQVRFEIFNEGSWNRRIRAGERGGQPKAMAHRLRHRRPRGRCGRRRPHSRPSCATHLERVRMAGYDLEVDAPRFVPLEVGAARLRRARLLPCARRRRPCSTCSRAGSARDGSLGFFHPDRFTLRSARRTCRRSSPPRRPSRASQSVTAQTFQRQRDDASSALDTGVLPMGRLEIARLDNDPNFPERGVLELTIGGGKCERALRLLRRHRRSARRLELENRPGLSAIALPHRRRTATSCADDRRADRAATDRRSAALAHARRGRPHDRAARRVGGQRPTCSPSTPSGSRRSRTSRTARTAVSLQELGQLIGYRLRPGVAAQTVRRVRARAAAGACRRRRRIRALRRP